MKPDLFTKSIHRTTLNGPVNGAGRMKVPFKPTTEHPLILSTSELGDFLRCRLRWNWRYRLGLESRKMGAPRGIGIVAHCGKDEWYKLAPKKRTVTAMERIAKQQLRTEAARLISAKDRDLAFAMLVGYAEWARGDHDESDRAVGKRIVFSEDPFVIPLDEKKTIYIRGKIDERFEPTMHKKTLAMDETKTKSSISFDMLDLNHQMTTYLFAMRYKYGKKFKRFMARRTIMRRQMPGPRVKAALFARSDPIERSDDELDQWLLDTRRQAKDILDAAIYPTFTDKCKFDCDFYNLCLVRSSKADVKFLIHSEFNQK